MTFNRVSITLFYSHEEEDDKRACGPTTCSDPVGIVDGGGVLFVSLRIGIREAHDLRIKLINKGNIINEIRQRNIKNAFTELPL